LDAIRGIAALLVVAQHTLEQVWPGFAAFSADYVSVGRVGVVAFFLVSGFIIPFSLERVGSLKQFWVSRIFRLYPLYWFSVISSTILFVLGPIHRHPTPVHTVIIDFLGNLTMIQRLFNIPGVSGLYWTLLAELAFYGSISILFTLGWSRQTLPLLMLLIGVALASIIPGVPHAKTVFQAAFWSSMFLLGTLIYRYWTGEVSKKAFTRACVLYLVVMAPVHCVVLHRSGQNLSPELGWLAGYALFAAMFLARERSFTKPLLFAGKTSYSIYLVHGTLLTSIYWLGRAPGCLFTVFGVIPCAWLTYKLIEEPFIELGKTLNKRLLVRAPRGVSVAQEG
jgi:peptidoglycan/LPS O-acetylase OafA/YrhL